MFLTGMQQRDMYGSSYRVKADITMESVKELGLEEGKECYAVIKATNVMFATQKLEGISDVLDTMDRDMVRAAIAAEDSKFCSHDGFDSRPSGFVPAPSPRSAPQPARSRGRAG